MREKRGSTELPLHDKTYPTLLSIPQKQRGEGDIFSDFSRIRQLPLPRASCRAAAVAGGPAVVPGVPKNLKI